MWWQLPKTVGVTNCHYTMGFCHRMGVIAHNSDGISSSLGVGSVLPTRKGEVVTGWRPA